MTLNPSTNVGCLANCSCQNDERVLWQSVTCTTPLCLLEDYGVETSNMPLAEPFAIYTFTSPREWLRWLKDHIPPRMDLQCEGSSCSRVASPRKRSGSRASANCVAPSPGHLRSRIRPKPQIQLQSGRGSAEPLPTHSRKWLCSERCLACLASHLPLSNLQIS